MKNNINPLTSYRIVYQITIGTLTITGDTTVTATIGTGMVDSVLLATLDMRQGGLFYNKIDVIVAGDSISSNDTLESYRTIAAATSEVVYNDSICAGDSSLLVAVTPADGDFFWLDSLKNLIVANDSLSTGPLSQTTKYYLAVESQKKYKVGPADESIGAFLFSSVDHALIFDVNVASTLDSVVVNSSSTGSITVNLENSTGTVIGSSTVNISQTGLQTIYLGLNLPVGTDYELRTTFSGVTLRRNSNGASYPYSTTGNEVVITGNSFSSTYYYYYYDWTVTSGGCPIDTMAYEVTVTSPPTATVSVGTNDTLFAQPGNAASYVWYLDGVEITGESDSFIVATDTGRFTVATTLGVCLGDTGAGTFFQPAPPLGLDGAVLGQILAYPNPAKDLVVVEMPATSKQNVTLSLVDINGRQLSNKVVQLNKGNNQSTVQLDGFSSGVYLLRVQSKSDVQTIRLMVE